MHLESLEIKKENWGDREGQYNARICVVGDDARIFMDLNPEVGNQIPRPRSPAPARHR